MRFSILVSVLVWCAGCGGDDGGGTPDGGTRTDGGGADGGDSDGGGADAAEPCTGTAPTCWYVNTMAGFGCCGGPSFAATCVRGEWRCGGGADTVFEDSCTRFDGPFCIADGGLDAGTVDSGLDAAPPIDAGPPADWAVCTTNTDCVLSADSCCGVCGIPEVDDFDGVNTSFIDEHYLDVCPESAMGPVPCPACPTGLNPNLFATCAAGRCEARDVRLDDTLVGCAADDECRLRVTQCCECGGDTSLFALIAIRNDAEFAYSSLVCDPLSACPGCAPVYPSEASAVCIDARCQVRIGE